MVKHAFGNTGILVSALGYGAMELRPEDEKNANILLNRALDEGISFIDTAPCYPGSEVLIGKSIAHRRNEYVLATKCGCLSEGWTAAHSYDRATFMANIDNSLKRMKTDYIDLLQIHALMPDSLPGGEADDAIRAMQEMKAAGKIRSICATFKNDAPTHPKYPDIISYENIRCFKDWKVFDVIQLVYGGLTRRCELGIDALAATGKGVIARGSMKQFLPIYDELYKQSGLSSLLEEGETKSDLLLRFTLSHPNVTTTLIGTKNIDHLLANIKAARRGPLTPGVYEKAKQMIDSVGQKALPV